MPKATQLGLPVLASAFYSSVIEKVEDHYHYETELVLSLSNDVSCKCENERIPGRKFSLFILPANVPHDFQCKHAARCICVLYRDEANVLDASPRVLDTSDVPHIRQWMHNLTGITPDTSPDHSRMAGGVLLGLLSALCLLEGTARHNQALNPRIAKAIKFIEDHWSEKIDAAMLASASHTSYSRLSSLFCRQFKCSPLDYHRQLRLSRTKALLKNPYLSVGEVAQQSGFDDTNYFVRAFRQKFGVPPHKWRST